MTAAIFGSAASASRNDISPARTARQQSWTRSCATWRPSAGVVRNSALDEMTAGETVHVEVLEDAGRVEAKLRDRGATVHRDGLRLEVTTTDEDPTDLIMLVLAATGSGLRSLRPSIKTLEDAYLAEERAER